MSIVLVARTSHEMMVPSRVVKCEKCGAECWLSVYSGDETMSLARAMGAGTITCCVCFGAHEKIGCNG